LGTFVGSSLSGPNIHKENSRQEEQRLQVPRAFLERTVQNLNEYVHACTAEPVFNLNELGISDWEERKAEKIVVSLWRPWPTKRYIIEYLER
jgi:hypothetical protein